jgi:hypothetical protein
MIRATLLFGLVAMLAASPATVQAEHQDHVQHVDELAMTSDAFTPAFTYTLEAPCCDQGYEVKSVAATPGCCDQGYNLTATGIGDGARKMVGFAALSLLIALWVLRSTPKSSSLQWT